MEQTCTNQSLTIDLVKNEIEKFLHQNQDRNQHTKRQKASCNQSSFCDGTIIAQKLMQILENEKETRTRGVHSPEKKVMSNSLVMREIFSYLDVYSLLKFRQVSRLWREEATSILSSQRHKNRHQEFLCVKFKAFVQGSKYGHVNGKSLEDFLEEFSQNSQMSIYSGFIFEGRFFNIDSTQLHFLTDFGTRIQYLNLTLEHLDVHNIRKILLEWTPNLQSLSLDAKLFWEGVSPLKRHEDPSLSLPKLKHVTLPKYASHAMSNSSDLILEILTCAPNLASIENSHLSYVTQIGLAGKVSLVKSLTWSFVFGTTEVTNLVNFVAAGPKLTSLQLEDFTQQRNSNSPIDIRIFPAIFRLLDLGRYSLERITGAEILGHGFRVDMCNDFRLLVLHNVTELHASAATTGQYPYIAIFPSRISYIFPNLESLHLKGYKRKAWPFTSCWNAHSSLKKLEISVSAYKLKIEHLRQWVVTFGDLYSNIVHLNVNMPYNVEENVPECLRLVPEYFKQLNQLVLRFYVGKNSYDPLKAEWNFDAALTGLSKHECNILKQTDEPNTEYQKIEILDKIRTTSSILDLKKLTNLTFEVQFRGNLQPLWSHVTERYAFQPMEQRQGLEVKVCGSYNNRIALTRSNLGSC